MRSQENLKGPWWMAQKEKPAVWRSLEGVDKWMCEAMGLPLVLLAQASFPSADLGRVPRLMLGGDLLGKLQVQITFDTYGQTPL